MRAPFLSLLLLTAVFRVGVDAPFQRPEQTCSSQVCLLDSRVRLACRVLICRSRSSATIAKPHHVLLAKSFELSACMSHPILLCLSDLDNNATSRCYIIARLLAWISPEKVIVNPRSCPSPAWVAERSLRLSFRTGCSLLALHLCCSTEVPAFDLMMDPLTQGTARR